MGNGVRVKTLTPTYIKHVAEANGNGGRNGVKSGFNH